MRHKTRYPESICQKKQKSHWLVFYFLNYFALLNKLHTCCRATVSIHKGTKGTFCQSAWCLFLLVLGERVTFDRSGQLLKNSNCEDGNRQVIFFPEKEQMLPFTWAFKCLVQTVSGKDWLIQCGCHFPQSKKASFDIIYHIECLAVMLNDGN